MPLKDVNDMDVLFRDEALLVVNKPSGLLVHRGWANDPVVAMSLARELVGRRVYPVHRLDRGCSGALVFALDKLAAASLQRSFANRCVDKRYLALVRGIAPEQLVIDHPIPNKPGGGRVAAVTEIWRRGFFERFSLVEARPATGRLHQVRRHLKHIAHPIVGDVNYGKGDINRLFRRRFGLHRLALHAATIALPHPVSGRVLKVTAPLTADLAEALESMDLLDAAHAVTGA